MGLQTADIFKPLPAPTPRASSQIGGGRYGSGSANLWAVRRNPMEMSNMPHDWSFVAPEEDKAGSRQQQVKATAIVALGLLLAAALVVLMLGSGGSSKEVGSDHRHKSSHLNQTSRSVPEDSGESPGVTEGAEGRQSAEEFSGAEEGQGRGGAEGGAEEAEEEREQDDGGGIEDAERAETGGAEPGPSDAEAKASSSRPAKAVPPSPYGNLTSVVLRPGCSPDQVKVTSSGRVEISAEVVQHTVQRLKDAKVTARPYQHVYIDTFFEPRFYKCMLAHLVQGSGSGGLKRLSGSNGHRFTLPITRGQTHGPSTARSAALGINRPFWRAFSKVFGADAMAVRWMAKFRRTVEPRLARAKLQLPWKAAARANTTKFSVDMDLSRDVTGYTINPHTDTDNKIVTTLYYMPSNSKLSRAGTLVLKSRQGLESKDGSGKTSWGRGGGFSVVTQAKFTPNSVFAFAPCYSSWHAVKRVANSRGAMRDTIQGFIHSTKKAVKQKCY